MNQYIGAFGGLDDARWLEVIKESLDRSLIAGVSLPGFPSSDLQESTVGLSGAAGLDEAARMYAAIKRNASRTGLPLNRDTRILDFGCGWGRVLRFFLKDVRPDNLFGLDVDSDLLNICEATRVPGTFSQVEPLGQPPFANGFFDLVYSYSVLTHLPQHVHLHWVAEIYRMLRPGGIFVSTLQPRRFIESLATCGPDDNSAWRRSLSRHARFVADFLHTYDAGELVFMPGEAEPYRPADAYGDAVVPRKFIERHWSPFFKIVDFIDDPDQLWQSVVVVQKLWPVRKAIPASSTPANPERHLNNQSHREAAVDMDLIAQDLAIAAKHLSRAMSLLAERLPTASNPADEDDVSAITSVGGPPVAANHPLDPNTTSVDLSAPRQTTERLHLARIPGHFYLDLGNYCNLRCPFCPTGNGDTKLERGFMTWENFQIVMDKIRPYAKLVSLYNWGEPFLHANIFNIIAYAAKTAHVHIDSNLSSRDFTAPYAEQLVRSGLTTLFASIDGVSQEVYEKYRVRGNVDRIFRNIVAIQNAKKALASETPHLGWLYHVSRFNEREMGEAAQRAKELAVPIVFKRLSSPDPAWWSSFHFDSEMVLEGGEWFNEAYAPPRNPDLDGVTLHKNVSEPCRQLFETMTIQWNGEVLPCTCVEGPDFSMGNVITDDLATVWNGMAFRRSREFVLNYGPVQNTGSVCECLDCPVAEKSIR